MAGKAITLHIEGVSYRADVWLNGERIADANQVAGVMRRFALDITKSARPGERNALAMRIQSQGGRDLGHTWVDWAPMPPDKMQGLWRDVFITASGTLLMHDPFVRSRLATNLASADLIVSMDLENTSDKPVTGTVDVTLDGVVTTIPVSVAGGVTQRVSLDGSDHPGLHLTKPRLWWPIASR
jgi:exo-1,4-beta-D-glucosaminidase